MDPVRALGLAASIIQCVQFAGKVVSQTYDIHQSAQGMTQASASLREIIDHLSSMNSDLTSKTLYAEYFQNKLQPAERRLQEVLQDMQKINSEILRTLEGLQLKANSGWHTVMLALKSVWHEQDVRRLQDK